MNALVLRGSQAAGVLAVRLIVVAVPERND
jgi:hypothetical protein